MVRPLFSALLLLISASFFLSCDKCDEPQTIVNPPLSASERTIIPDQIGDTLQFTDDLGNLFSLVCNTRELRNDGYSSIGHTRPCEDSYYSWENLSVAYSSNLLLDSGAPIVLRISISGGMNEREFRNFPSITNCIRPPGKFFTVNLNNQFFYGFTDENAIPRIRNFNFRSDIKLQGRHFQNINYNSLKPNSETNCPAPVASTTGIDSIYYSTQFGIIRLTTVGGKKYQRIL